MSAPHSGWIAVHRGWMQSPDFQPEPFTEREAFLWSIEQAAHAPHLQWFNGAQVPVGRGEFATSIRAMASAFKWGERKARGFLARMEKCGKWTQRATHACTVLTVCNYERFQAPTKRADTANDTAATQQRHSRDTQQNNGNNGNNGNKEEEASPPSRAVVAILPFDDALAAWTQAATLKGWSPVQPTLPLSDKRRRGLGKVLKAHGLDAFVTALQRAMDSPLLGGPDPPAWFNFDFVCNTEKFVKLKDGNYDRQFSSNRSSAPGRGSEWAAAGAEALAAR